MLSILDLNLFYSSNIRFYNSIVFYTWNMCFLTLIFVIDRLHKWVWSASQQIAFGMFLLMRIQFLTKRLRKILSKDTWAGKLICMHLNSWICVN